ncbi:SDR family NAD(P)-dependent oxidoreductase [Novosphingobium sp. Gsoil 351]|uniref:SDR family NAD(P)-dependent oxidoreductase n=1 Tax=Novosphingobium sp. Gsoil 351 TaxID=2675225 RepID=UPI0012B48DAB|nr:glucose 1-dehydrogenase [Novosphingobium sp. Gsoil 351]QGN53992.1 glucose 1-dehydrogenase [Novosphingobium sp. Gsoil 351]
MTDKANATDFANRVALITGAGQGIGRVFAKGFARAGAKIAIVELNEAKARAVAAEIEQECGKGTVIVAPADVAEPADVDAAVAATLTAFGRIDIAINNAAIFSTLKMRPFEDIPFEEWRDVMRVNVDGVMLVAKACAPVMRKSRHGRIINISSGVVTLGRPHYLHYVASKAAVVGMTRAMARELGADGITVNALLPGATFTEIERETVTPEQKSQILAMQCIKRHETADDLLAAALYLASDGAEFVTGQSIAVDGGTTFR